MLSNLKTGFRSTCLAPDVEQPHGSGELQTLKPFVLSLPE